MFGRRNKLPQAVSKQVGALCAQGDTLAEQQNYPDALKAYWAAWELLPEPKKDWEAATWILAAVGDANFHGGDFVAGHDILASAMHCPNAIGNPERGKGDITALSRPSLRRPSGHG
jgi:hypothetical protein